MIKIVQETYEEINIDKKELLIFKDDDGKTALHLVSNHYEVKENSLSKRVLM